MVYFALYICIPLSICPCPRQWRGTLHDLCGRHVGAAAGHGRNDGFRHCSKCFPYDVFAGWWVAMYIFEKMFFFKFTFICMYYFNVVAIPLKKCFFFKSLYLHFSIIIDYKYFIAYEMVCRRNIKHTKKIFIIFLKVYIMKNII